MRVATPGTVLVPLHGKGGSVRAWAIVDEADAAAVQRYRWFLSGRRRANSRQLNTHYAKRNATIDGRKRGVYLHRDLLGLPPDSGAEIGEDRGCATAPGDDAEAAAERELLRLCFVHAKDAAWAQWFHEEVYSRPGGKVAALAFYCDWEATQRQGGAA
jgi:hypothetical protein